MMFLNVKKGKKHKAYALLLSALPVTLTASFCLLSVFLIKFFCLMQLPFFF